MHSQKHRFSLSKNKETHSQKPTTSTVEKRHTKKTKTYTPKKHKVSKNKDLRQMFSLKAKSYKLKKHKLKNNDKHSKKNIHSSLKSKRHTVYSKIIKTYTLQKALYKIQRHAHFKNKEIHFSYYCKKIYQY